eukprot:ANDGO_00053.mRNA.1 Ultraviolet-B receptor UVR8
MREKEFVFAYHQHPPFRNLKIVVPGGIDKVCFSRNGGLLLSRDWKLYSILLKTSSGEDDLPNLFGSFRSMTGSLFSRQSDVFEVELQLHPFFVEKTVSQIAAGSDHYLVVCRDDNKLYAWGDGSDGQLGLDAISRLTHPVPVPVMYQATANDKAVEEKISMVWAGYNTTFIGASSGRIYSCGRSDMGQLGFASMEPVVRKPRLIKSLAKFGEKVSLIAVGEEACVAVLADGRCVQWGHLKDIRNFPPHALESLFSHRIVSACAGDRHFLATTSEGIVFAWGRNASGSLGTGVRTDSWAPVRIQIVDLSTKTIGIAVSHDSSYSLTSDGSLFAWGLDVPRSVGGSVKPCVEYSPIRVESVADKSIKRVFAGATCVFCTFEPEEAEFQLMGETGPMFPTAEFGSDGRSGEQLNSPKGRPRGPMIPPLQRSMFQVRPLQQSSSPTPDRPASGAQLRHIVHVFGEKSISGSEAQDENYVSYPLALDTDNSFEIAEGDHVRGVAVGYAHVVLCLQSGRIIAWGSNTYGQCAVGGPQGTLLSKIRGAGYAPDSRPGSASGSSNSNSPYLDILSVSCGGNHTLILGRSGNVYASGANSNGECGIGNTNAAVQALHLVGLDTEFEKCRVIKIAAGWNHSAAVTDDGSVWVWGMARFGQLGLGTTECVVTPQRIQFPAVAGEAQTKLIDVCCGRNHTIFLSDAGQIWVCGQNTNGQCGIPTTESREVDVPIRIQSLVGKHIISITSGSSHCLALDTLGRIWAWGSGNSGRLGCGDSKDRYEPVLVEGLQAVKVALIFSGPTSYHSLCVTEYGEMYSWGSGKEGQLAHQSQSNEKIAKPSKTMSGKRTTLIAASQRCSIVVESAGGWTGAIGVPHSARLHLMNREYLLAERELDHVKSCYETMQREYSELATKYRRLCAEDLSSLEVSDLDQLERLYLEGITKVASTKQDILLHELQDKQERLQKGTETKYRAALDAIQRREEEARLHMEHEKKRESSMKEELRLLRSEMESALKELEVREQLEHEHSIVREKLMKSTGDVEKLERITQSLQKQYETTNSENRSRKEQLRSMQEDFFKLQEELSSLRTSVPQKDLYQTSLISTDFMKDVAALICQSDADIQQLRSASKPSSTRASHLDMILLIREARRRMLFDTKLSKQP